MIWWGVLNQTKSTMADFFFFTDVDLLNSQTADQAYGPIQVTDFQFESGKEKYRLTSLHSASSNPLAYAVCKGIILVQQSIDDQNLVNIILKPEDQSELNNPRIKYFIYKGILKNSLTDGVNVIDGNNTLTKHILASNPTTSQKVLGIDLIGTNFTDNDFIDNAFYTSKDGYDLWNVGGGWSLGTFDKDKIGIEIIFDTLGFEPTFDTARKLVTIFSVDIQDSPSDADLFESRMLKETVLHFMDPCALYTNRFEQKTKYRNSNDETDDNNIHSFSKVSGDELYSTLINGSDKHIFYNRNRIYIDIRNDLNYSFNLLENLDNNLMALVSSDRIEPTVEINYYNSGWPILIFENPQVSENELYVNISFPVKIDVSYFIALLTGNRFISLIEKVKGEKNSFLELTNDIDSSYSTNYISVKIPVVDQSIAVGQFIKMKIFIHTLNNEVNDLGVLNPNLTTSLDYVFQPTKLRIPFENDDPIKIKIYHEYRYINLLNDLKIDYLSDVGIAKDNFNTVLFWNLSKRKSKKRFKKDSPFLSITNSTNKDFQYFTKYIESISNPDHLLQDKILVSNDEIKLVKQKRRKVNFTRNKINLNTDFFAVILSNADFQSIISLATQNFDSKFPPYLTVSQISKELDNQEKKYIRYSLALSGFVRNQVDGIEIQQFEIGIDIFNYYTNDLK